MSTNAFESGERKVIPAVLVYARQGDRFLMIHRNGRANDYHSGKWNGLGGKCEADESPLQAARREFAEESGITLSEAKFRSLGVIQFPNFKAHKSEDWVVFVFTAEVVAADCARLAERSDEGTLHWVPATELATLSLWAGDRYFIPHVVSGEPFMGTIWYEGEEVRRHWIAPLNA